MKQSVYFSLVLLAVLGLSSCGSKGNDEVPVVVPVIKIEDATVTRVASDVNMRFRITLNKTTTVPVSVNYQTEAGSAAVSTDFTETSGTATIAAGSNQTEVQVPVKGDPTNTRRENLLFKLNLTNPVNGVTAVPFGTGTISSENGLNLVTDNTGYTTPESYPGYTLAWADEFSGTTVDQSAWNFETGNGTNGWGNHELEYYTNSTNNIFVSNGNLIIEARKQAIGGQNYSSGRMTTFGKKNFQFGRIDMRAKLPVAKGLWPALWMLGSNINTTPWPACGELDMMELIGVNPSTVYGTMHWNSASNVHGSRGSSFNLPSGNFSHQFHVFSLIWVQDQVQWLVDDQVYLTTTRADVGAANYPFNAPEFLIFNVAVGGDWPGAPDANTTFPQRMFVDYVRVFQ